MAEAKHAETVIQRFPTTAAVLRCYNTYVSTVLEELATAPNLDLQGIEFRH